MNAGVQLKDLVEQGAARLSAAGVENARLDAELLMAFAARTTREGLLAKTIAADEGVRERYAQAIGMRAARRPLAYITGRREFHSIELEVSHEVLIPRPETETVVNAALSWIAERPAARIVDLCTGSGAIALAIAVNAPQVEVVGTDISADALAIAMRNAARLELTKRVKFRRADCWTVLDGGEQLGQFDLVVANPPYICESEMTALAPEIRHYEPRIALAGGIDGLTFYRRIATEAGHHLEDGGAAMVEVGEGQAAPVAAIFRAAGLREITTIDDLARITRVVVAS
ncbi:MAG TPA: peptide chain release factor N(5)-glutamine methyltransferase [Candidatus Binataceae bacterium]|nr:peptide chain release factor N(5)-glutamine methyltransferase [Candidatus Binataceae bacterium]